MKKVLSKDDLIVSGPVCLNGAGSDLFSIKDVDTQTTIVITPIEAKFISDSLTELLNTSSNPPPDQF